MHIKITRSIIEDNEVSHAFTSCNYILSSQTQEEIIVPISCLSLSKATVYTRHPYTIPKEHYIAHISNAIPSYQSTIRNIEITEEEYKRIEKLLSLNNKKELEIVHSSYPEINVKNAIKDLQVNDDE